ncbi:hypothetical protein A2U01_0118962, partial [Trifolium medium]|nr:hypothetical protein [Trifolium medium]
SCGIDRDDPFVLSWFGGLIYTMYLFSVEHAFAVLLSWLA